VRAGARFQPVVRPGQAQRVEKAIVHLRAVVLAGVRQHDARGVAAGGERLHDRRHLDEIGARADDA
jgi:hypothetical protein